MVPSGCWIPNGGRQTCQDSYGPYLKDAIPMLLGQFSRFCQQCKGSFIAQARADCGFNKVLNPQPHVGTKSREIRQLLRALETTLVLVNLLLGINPFEFCPQLTGRNSCLPE